jgi:uncharacterized membrane protein HdeD (DUF308 family)
MRDVRKFIGLLLFVFGIFWMGLSGLCSAAFGVAFLQQGEQLADVMIVLFIGIPSIVAGYLLFAFGRWLRNQPDE